MEMINIINRNRNRVYKKKQQILVQKKIRSEKISNALTIAGYLIATYAFVQVVTLLVK